MKPKIDFTKLRYLPYTQADALKIMPGTLGMEALHEALAGGANDASRVGMARLIAAHGQKYTDEARHHAFAITVGLRPLPPIPAYMVKP